MDKQNRMNLKTQKTKKKIDYKRFIVKHYKGIILFLLFLLGTFFPAQAWLQYAVTGMLMIIISQLIGKLVSALDRYLLNKFAPEEKKIQSLEDLCSQYGLDPELTEDAIKKFTDSLPSEEEYFKSKAQNNDSDVK